MTCRVLSGKSPCLSCNKDIPESWVGSPSEECPTSCSFDNSRPHHFNHGVRYLRSCHRKKIGCCILIQYISLASRVLTIFEEEILGHPPRNGALLVNEEGRILNESATGGVRTTHFGCLPTLRKTLEEAAARSLVQPSYRFVDALILSSKVLMAEEILLELCASDDPNYQTGYIASRTTGYIRIPFIKPEGLPRGGRLYILKSEHVLKDLLAFLRETPVLFSSQQPHSPLPFNLASIHDLEPTGRQG